MDIVVTGRHIQVSDRLRDYLSDRLAKVEQIAPKVTRIDVVVKHERSTTRDSESVELTCRERGNVVRAEATNQDKYAAVDLAVEKLLERLRRASGKRRATIRSNRPDPAAEQFEPALPPPSDNGSQQGTGPFGAVGDSPIEVREKVHSGEPMTLAEAVNRMELVGHDFYLFNDADTGRASVVYRRRGWSYGVIHLDPAPALQD